MARAKREALSDEEVLAEIEQLKDSPYVKIARKANQMRQKLYALRYLDKQGRQIAAEREKAEKGGEQVG